ncbi:SMI1/KNR4 family protein [Nonomuraea sp. NPDC050328]|uniref:SMI1/KNR4 family protein n=1 Tax=Nonomuraea sp. NPDC050328 TaxID=3364361 RepID=UPI0037BBE40A
MTPPVPADDDLVASARLRPDLLPPASAEAVADAEEAIGAPLPPLLRRLYLEVANGGFGPRDGVLGVAGSDYAHHPEFADLLDARRAFGAAPGLVWWFDWGCGIWTVLDCRDPAGPLWIWDAGGERPWLTTQHMTLAQWLGAAFDGRLERAFETSGLTAIANRFQPGATSSLVTGGGPVSSDDLAEAERVIGAPLPPLLRRRYLERGAGVELAGLAEVVERHRLFSSGPDAYVPAHLLWLRDWGDSTWSLVDRRDPAGPIWLWDPLGAGLVEQDLTLARWLDELPGGSAELADGEVEHEDR